MESRYRHLLSSPNWSQSQHPANFPVSMSLRLDTKEIFHMPCTNQLCGLSQSLSHMWYMPSTLGGYNPGLCPVTLFLFKSNCIELSIYVIVSICSQTTFKFVFHTISFVSDIARLGSIFVSCPYILLNTSSEKPGVLSIT